MGKALFSALILTLNEEKSLPHCLASLVECDDIVVLDSKSSDSTAQIAKENGAKFLIREFDNYGSQRNYGLNEVAYKNKWVFIIDADERMTPELMVEINNTCTTCSEGTHLFRLRRKDFFMGRWIKGASGYPTWFGRLARVGHVEVKREINEEYVTDGDVGLLENHLEHFPFEKGIYHWLERHNNYSSMEARLLMQQEVGVAPLSDVFHTDPAVRRTVLKSLLYKTPGRPFIVFCYLYIVRGGFLEGRAGLTFCLLRSFYEFLISCKKQEALLEESGKTL